ncbi:MAG TPA: stage II sporulation protein M, partial [Pyrinomonadaceae bacterium]
FTHNIQVTIYTFAFGALLGIGTLFYLAYNAAMIAATLSLTYQAGFGNDLLTFMVGHGFIELSCIFIAGGAGLLIGSALLMPGDLTRGDALKTRGMEAVRLMIGVAVLLVLAGMIEGFISPAPISPVVKFSIGGLTGVALYTYLLLGGR